MALVLVSLIFILAGGRNVADPDQELVKLYQLHVRILRSAQVLVHHSHLSQVKLYFALALINLNPGIFEHSFGRVKIESELLGGVVSEEERDDVLEVSVYYGVDVVGPQVLALELLHGVLNLSWLLHARPHILND
jgi:hypothetical protein